MSFGRNRVVGGKATFGKDVLEIGQISFSKNKELTSATIPEGVVNIRAGAFFGCTNLRTVTVPLSVTSIGKRAFKDCSSLVSINIPHGVKTIGECAFDGCARLTSVVLPSTVVNVGDGAWKNCVHLIVAVIPNPHTTFLSSSEQSTAPTLSHGVFAGCERLQLAIAPAMLSDPSMHFETTVLDCLLRQGLDDTSNNRQRASDLQFWAPETHHLCTTAQKRWIRELFLIGGRLWSDTHVWVTVLQFVRTCDITEHFLPRRGISIGNPFFAKNRAPSQTKSGFGGKGLGKALTALGSPDTTSESGSLDAPPPVDSGNEVSDAARAFSAKAAALVDKLKARVKPLNASDKPKWPEGPNNNQKISKWGTTAASPSGRTSPFGRTSPAKKSFNPAVKSPIAATTVRHAVASKEDLPGWSKDCETLKQNKFGVTVTKSPKKILPHFAVTIPEAVTVIEPSAFARVRNLFAVTIHGKVTTISKHSFRGCENLQTIEIAEGVTEIGEEAFSQCAELRTVSIPSSVKVIGPRAFQSCVNLASINFPPGLIEIGEEAFVYCRQIHTVSIPSNVKVIARGTFKQCIRLTSITLPPEITEIKKEAFADCASLSGVTLPPGLCALEERVFARCSALAELSIPESVTTIGCEALMATALSTVVIPAAVANVGRGAFKATQLVSVEFQRHEDMTLGPCVFQECAKLTSITLPIGLTVINHDTFAGCILLASLEIPQGVVVIDYGAFAECSNLMSMAIPPGVQRLSSSTFRNCSSLETIEIPTEVTEIGARAFNKCTGLQTCVLPPNITEISDGLFLGCSALESITIPPMVTKIGRHSFKDCEKLHSVDLSIRTEAIMDDAFQGCHSLANVDFPEGLQVIGLETFAGCLNLTSALLPDTVSCIGPGAFAGCEWLVVACIPSPDVVLSAPRQFARGSPQPIFARCTRLEYVLAPHLHLKEHLLSCPALRNGGWCHEDTPGARHRTVELTFWGPLIHRLCAPPRRRCVRMVLLCAERLSARGLHLHPEMWRAVLGTLRIHELGNSRNKMEEVASKSAVVSKAMGGRSIFLRKSQVKPTLKFVGTRVKTQKQSDPWGKNPSNLTPPTFRSPPPGGSESGERNPIGSTASTNVKADGGVKFCHGRRSVFGKDMTRISKSNEGKGNAKTAGDERPLRPPSQKSSGSLWQAAAASRAGHPTRAVFEPKGEAFGMSSGNDNGRALNNSATDTE
eukprot:m.108052 g.108052  ORF g.108052 m.108052 type:complete len:1210 (-) comp12789_c0_seq2:325-3954(-)